MKTQELENELAEVDQQISAAEGDTGLQARVVDLRRELDGHNQMITRREQDVTIAQGAVDGMPARLDRVRSHRQELAYSLERLEAAQGDDVGSLSQLRGIDESLDAMDWFLDHGEAKTKTLKARLREAKRRLKQGQDEAAPVAAQLAEAEKQLHTLKRNKDVDGGWMNSRPDPKAIL